MSEVILTSKTFEKETKKGNWIVDFWAEWCNPCKILSPELEKAGKEMHGKVKIGKVDVDNENDLAQQYDVMSLPTLLFIKNGEVVDKSVGVIYKADIVKRAEKVFK